MTLISRLICIFAVLLMLAFGLFFMSRAPNFQLCGTLVSHGPRDMPGVALTLDDGPTPGFTVQTLELLAERDVPATFFLTGQAAERHPDTVKLIADAGHEIGNHSYSHRRMVLKSSNFVTDELDRTDAALRAAGYDGPLHFRPPYGKKLFVLPWILSRQDRLSVTWDVDGDGDRSINEDAQAIAEHVIASTQNGSIILLHVMFSSREALPLIIDGLRAQGMEFMTVSELLKPAQ